jgi:hypothetical protein
MKTTVKLVPVKLVALASLTLFVLTIGGTTSRSKVEGAPSSGSRNGNKDITPETHKSIDKGIAWLLKAMRPNGGVGMDLGAPSDLGCSSMTGLALMSHGSTPTNGPHKKELDKILQYVLSAVEGMPEKTVESSTTSNLQGKIGHLAHHFFAAVFLAEALGDSPDNEEIKRGLGKLVRIISSSQQADGAWGGQSWAPMLGTVMGWVSLRASHSAGMKVGASADKTAQALIKQLGNQPNQGWMHELYKNVSGIRVLYAMKKEDDARYKQAFQSALGLVKGDDRAFYSAGGEEYLAFHLITECMLQKRGEAWQTWYPTVRDKIVRVQNADGSWTGHHCITSRTFCTAAALLTLQAPNRYLPISDI